MLLAICHIQQSTTAQVLHFLPSSRAAKLERREFKEECAEQVVLKTGLKYTLKLSAEAGQSL